MNKRQKTILIEFGVVIAITAVAVVAMIVLKDWVNRSEAILAMQELGEKTLQYRRENGSVPPESWVDLQEENLPGAPRLGQVQYRGLWIDFESPSDAILAYSQKNYRSPLVGHGYVVLLLDGRVQWLEKEEFEKLLARQQTEDELRLIREQHQSNDTGIPPL